MTKHNWFLWPKPGPKGELVKSMHSNTQRSQDTIQLRKTGVCVYLTRFLRRTGCTPRRYTWSRSSPSGSISAKPAPRAKNLPAQANLELQWLDNVGPGANEFSHKAPLGQWASLGRSSSLPLTHLACYGGPLLTSSLMKLPWFSEPFQGKPEGDWRHE